MKGRLKLDLKLSERRDRISQWGFYNYKKIYIIKTPN